MRRFNINSFDKRDFILVFVVLLLLSTPALVWLEKQQLENDLAKAQVKSEWSVQMEQSIVSSRLSALIPDISFLYDIYGTRLENEDNYDAIAREWMIFSNKRQIYDQVRFIAANGDEKIRIDLKPDGAIRVAAKDLQNKADRYYFYEAAALPPGALHISPLDLNIERGQIETPFKPMLRLGMPVYKNGTLLGVIELNYLAKDFLNAFKEYAITTDSRPVLLNGNGYYLANNENVKEWGFMFKQGKKHRFDIEYPEDWTGVQQGVLRQFTSNGLFTSWPISVRSLLLYGKDHINMPHPIYCSDTWYIVGVLPRNADNPYLYTEDNAYLFSYVIHQPAFVILVLLALLLAFIGAQTIKRYRQIHYRADYDTLTKAYSREGGMSKLRYLAQAAKGIDMIFSVCFVDVNGLKEVNDNLGHAYGDEMMVAAINTINTQIRQHDYIIRMGGDEFLIVFPYSDVVQAEKVWQRIRKALDRINYEETRPYCISLSHGIVDNRMTQNIDVDQMIKMADDLMYKEKQIIKGEQRFCSIKDKPKDN
jgi:diguanylate cyclase (GGDEF)-like protein